MAPGPRGRHAQRRIQHGTAHPPQPLGRAGLRRGRLGPVPRAPDPGIGPEGSGKPDTLDRVPRKRSAPAHDAYVRVRGARVHNLRDVDVDIPRDALVAFTGISGSGKSSLAFGTIYAEAQRRYFESVAPVRPPAAQPDPGAAGQGDHRAAAGGRAAAAPRRRAAPARRSGTLTTLSNLLRMLLSRAGTYPRGHHRAAGLRRLLPQHRGRRLPDLPRAGPHPRGHRTVDGPRPDAEHPRRRGRRLARRVAGRQPARHPRRARLRRRPAVARAAEASTATGSSTPTSSRSWRCIRTGTAARAVQRHGSGAPGRTSCTR